MTLVGDGTGAGRSGEASIDIGVVIAALWARKWTIVALTIITLAIVYAVLLFVPRTYESAASVLIEPRSNYFVQGNEPVASGGVTDAAMVSSQIELIRSRDTLLRVIEAENLLSVPEFTNGGFSPMGLVRGLLGREPDAADLRETALANLFDRLTVIQQRDSRVVSISVRSEDPALAARLANGIANAHVERRTEAWLSDTADASVWLAREIEQMTGLVAEAEARVASFRVDNDLFSGANNTSLLDQQLTNVANQISAAQERQNSARARAEVIRGLIAAGQPIEGAQDVRSSVVIQQLSERKAQLQAERAQRSATLLPSHPTVRALSAQIAEVDAQILVEGRRVAAALEAEAQIEAGIATQLAADLERLKAGSATATQDNVQLAALEREARAQRELLETYLARYREALSRSDGNSALPDVRVVTLAAPSVSPASPRTMMILLAVAIVMLTLQIGWVIVRELLSGRAVVAPASRIGRDVPVAAGIVPLTVLPEEPQQAARAEDLDRLPEQPFVPEGAEDEPADGIDAEAAAEGDEAPIVAEDDGDEAPTVVIARAEPDHDEDADWPVEAWTGDLERERAAAAEEAEEAASGPEAEAVPGSGDAGMVAGALSLDIAKLAADLATGRDRIVLLSALISNRNVDELAETLVADALDRGLSVAVVDAGSYDVGDLPGITDLSLEQASYGEVVHKPGPEGLAEVPWGTYDGLNPGSTRPLTLAEALSDVYEIVIVKTGPVGIESSLPLFDGLKARLVMVGDGQASVDETEALKVDLRHYGFPVAEVIAAPARSPEVA